jgi:DNA repair protein RadC
MDAMPDYELLELILFRAIPRRDVKPLAKALLDRFRSFPEVLAAAPERLLECEGVTDSVVTEIKIVQAASLRAAQTKLKERPLFSAIDEVHSYLRAAMAFQPTEQCRVLYLDTRNKLIAEEVHSKGTINHTPVYTREIIKRALELSSTALFIAHNHPGGDPRPSDADVKLTKELVQIAKPLGITIHDHLILGRDGIFSFREKKLLGEKKTRATESQEAKPIPGQGRRVTRDPRTGALVYAE